MKLKHATLRDNPARSDSNTQCDVAVVMRNVPQGFVRESLAVAAPTSGTVVFDVRFL
jgi:hypothetical protein